MLSTGVKLAALTLLFVGLAMGHGYLASPDTRDILQGRQNYEMWAPVGHVNRPGCSGCEVKKAPEYPQYTCGGIEYDGTSDLLALTAGQNLDLSWYLNAPHPGECLIYLSTGPTDDPETEWYLIDVIWNCAFGEGKESGDTVEGAVTIPEYALDCEHCVLRWEWYAIQQVDAIEYYVQCVDVSISSDNTGTTPTPTIAIPGWQSADASLYRNEYNPQPDDSYTGPEIASVSGYSYTPLNWEGGAPQPDGNDDGTTDGTSTDGTSTDGSSTDGTSTDGTEDGDGEDGGSASHLASFVLQALL
ncbi:Tegument protein VP13/14 [Balamuthia mandrillaris]